MAAIGATLAAAPALVYAYAQMGAIKELTAPVSVLLLGSLLVMLPRLLTWTACGCGPGVVCAAGVCAIGIAFLPWLARQGWRGSP